eukprot:743588-Amphidinium_carterae.1
MVIGPLSLTGLVEDRTTDRRSAWAAVHLSDFGTRTVLVAQWWLPNCWQSFGFWTGPVVHLFCAFGLVGQCAGGALRCAGAWGIAWRKVAAPPLADDVGLFRWKGNDEADRRAGVQLDRNRYMRERAAHSSFLWQAAARLVGVMGAIVEELVLRIASDCDPLPPAAEWPSFME